LPLQLQPTRLLRRTRCPQILRRHPNKYQRIQTAAYLPTETSATTNTAAASPADNNSKTNSSVQLLTADEAQSLTKLNAGNVYDLGIVNNSTELASSLATDIDSGLISSRHRPKNNQNGTSNTNSASVLTLDERAARYGTNRVASPPSATFFELFLEALDDFTVKILLGAGTASLALEYWLAGNDGSSPNWIEGASILAAVAVVTLVTAGNNYQKEQQFKALQEISNEESVRALRGGREVQLSTFDVLVGDLLLVETGDILCADGVLVDGTDIKVDESHLTGEADDVAKDAIKAQALYSGSKVVSGFGRMIVTAVGKRSQSGAVAEMIAVAGEGRWATHPSSLAPPASSSSPSELTYTTEGLGRLREETALQKKLVGYATVIGQLGLGAAVLASVGLASRFSYDTFVVAQQPWDWVYLHNYLNFFITGVTILVRI
jgi:Ca2+ transporting ATPase